MDVISSTIAMNVWHSQWVWDAQIKTKKNIKMSAILRLDIDHKTKEITVTGYVYEDIGIEACKDGFCLPVGGVCYTICKVKFNERN